MKEPRDSKPGFVAQTKPLPSPPPSAVLPGRLLCALLQSQHKSPASFRCQVELIVRELCRLLQAGAGSKPSGFFCPMRRA